MLLIFNPVLENKGSVSLVKYQNWNDPASLVTRYIQDIREVSGGFVDYQVVETREASEYPAKEDGFFYTNQSYLGCLDNHDSCHREDTANYQKILSDLQVCDKVNRGEIDELWLFGGPYFGFYESRLAGPNSFWYNSPGLSGTSCQRQLPITGFSYERGVPEMLEDMGHRVEATMEHLFGPKSVDSSTLWNKFSLREIDISGSAGCGSVHFAPNSTFDYDWANEKTVQSNCDDWLNYPNLTGSKTMINCKVWNCDGYSYKKWWLSHIPHFEGKTNGIWNNWWKYVLDYQEAERN